LFGGCNVTAVGETWTFGGGDYITVPVAITDLRAALIDSAIQLSWSEIAEDTGGNPTSVESYIIYRNVDPDFSSESSDSIGSTADTFYVDSTAAVKDSAINHYYVVRATDSGGRKSADSNKVGESDRDLLTSP